MTFSTHKEASRVQDFCGEACSILYRAPELFNITVDSKLDERVDIWSLGCTLYCMLFYTSPFESAYYDGSVALAAMNAKVNIPQSSRCVSIDEMSEYFFAFENIFLPSMLPKVYASYLCCFYRYSSEVHQLVLSMLQADPSHRPYIDAVLETVEKLMNNAS